MRQSLYFLPLLPFMPDYPSVCVRRATTPHGVGQASAATIQSLPNEVLLEIFLHCVHPRMISIGDYPCPEEESREVVLCLQRVCRHWHDVVQSSALLWTNITLVGDDASDYISLAVRNSRQAKIDVNAQLITDEEYSFHRDTVKVDQKDVVMVAARLLDVLRTCMARVRSLTVDASVQGNVDRLLSRSQHAIGDASALEVLILTGELSADSVWLSIISAARNLQQLWLNDLCGVETWSSPSFSQLKSLRKLEMGYDMSTIPSLSAFLSFIRNFPALEYLGFIGWYGPEEIGDEASECEPVSLRRLRKLAVVDCVYDATFLTLISGLILPFDCEITCSEGGMVHSRSLAGPPLPLAVLTRAGASIAGTYKEVSQLNLDIHHYKATCTLLHVFPTTDPGECERDSPKTIPLPLHVEMTGPYCAALKLGGASVLSVNCFEPDAHVFARHGEFLPGASLCDFCEALCGTEELELGCCFCEGYDLFIASFLWCHTAGIAHFRGLKRVELSYRIQKCTMYDGEPVRGESEEGFNNSVVDALMQRQASAYPIEQLTIRVPRRIGVDPQVLVERLSGIVEVVVDVYTLGYD